MLETFLPDDYYGEAKEHRKRRDQLDRIVDDLREVTPFDIGRRSVDRKGDDVGADEAIEEANISQWHSEYLLN